MSTLSHIKVIEIGEALAAPYAAMILGDLGADVIKIERVEGGDQSREWGARLENDESAYFFSTNRNKRSLTLDLQSAKGQEILYKLLEKADVLFCNIPGGESLARTGLEIETIRQKFPRLVYASITGYGRSGPKAGKPAYDLIAQGESGLMRLSGDTPTRSPLPPADLAAGLYSVIGILTALLGREHTGQGQVIEVSLIEALLSVMTPMTGDFFAHNASSNATGYFHPSIAPPYQVFQTQTRPVVIGVGSERQWRRFCKALNLSDMETDPRFSTQRARRAHRIEASALLQERIVQFTAEELLEKLAAVGVPCGPVNTLTESLSDPHYVERGNIIEQVHPITGLIRSIASPLRMSETPPEYRLPPPTLGEHSEAILSELGYSAAEIQELSKL